MKNFTQLGVIVQDIAQPILDKVPELKAVKLGDFLSMELPPRENIIDPWLPRGGLVMVFAKRGVGKTYFALELAMAVANGGKFLSFQAPRPARVLYLDGEMPANVMQARLKEIKNRIQQSENMIEPIFVTPDLQDDFMPDLGTSEGRESLRKLTKEADLIIVDNLSTLCGSVKENDADAWLDMQQWGLQLRRQGKSVMFIHHAGKGGLQRGTSKREDILDTVISLRHPTDYEASMGACFEIHFEKSRGMVGDSVNPIYCKLTEEGWQYDALEQSSYIRVVALANEGLKQTDIAQELGLSPGQISKLVKRAKTSGDIKGQ